MNKISVPIFDKMIDKIEGLVKSLPRLNKTVADQLARNAWVVDLVFAIWLTLSFIFLFQLTLFADAVLRQAQGLVISNTAFVYLSLLVMLITLALLYLAVTPLKEMHRYGWKLLAYAGLTSFALSLFRALYLGYSAGRFIIGLIFWLASLLAYYYILFNIKDRFKTSR